MNCGSSRSGYDRENFKIRPGAAGLMTSFLGWRRAIKSAVMRQNAAGIFALEVSASMNCDRRSPRHVFAGAAFGALALGSPALAADMALKAPAYKAVYDWTGFYLGGHVGYGDGGLGPGTHPPPEQGRVFSPTSTGVTAGAPT